MDIALLSAAIYFAAALAITEAMSPHKFSDQMISHSFHYSVLQIVGFLLAAGALIHTGLWVAIITGIALILVPFTGVVRKPFGKYRKRLHVASAGTAFGGVFVMGVLHSTTVAQVALVAAYPASVLLAWLVWRSDVVCEKVAAYACIAWLIAYSAGI